MQEASVVSQKALIEQTKKALAQAFEVCKPSNRTPNNPAMRPWKNKHAQARAAAAELKAQRENGIHNFTSNAQSHIQTILAVTAKLPRTNQALMLRGLSESLEDPKQAQRFVNYGIKAHSSTTSVVPDTQLGTSNNGVNVPGGSQLDLGTIHAIVVAQKKKPAIMAKTDVATWKFLCKGCRDSELLKLDDKEQSLGRKDTGASQRRKNRKHHSSRQKPKPKNQTSSFEPLTSPFQTPSLVTDNETLHTALQVYFENRSRHRTPSATGRAKRSDPPSAGRAKRQHAFKG